MSERQSRTKKKKELRETHCKGKTNNETVINKQSNRNENELTLKCRNQKTIYCFLMWKFITQLFRHQEVGREEDAGEPQKYIRGFKILVRQNKKRISKMAPHWSANKWMDVLSKEGKEKEFNIVWNQTIQEHSCTFEPFKDTQEEPILEILSLILCRKTMHRCQRILPRMCITSDTKMN